MLPLRGMEIRLRILIYSPNLPQRKPLLLNSRPMQASGGDLRPNAGWIRRTTSTVRTDAPTLIEWIGAAATTLLLVISFPNFDLSLFAWIALAPLLVVIARRPSPLRAFILGWLVGTVFFYLTCYWLTYSMIHYGGLPTWLAYLLLVPGALVIGVFPALSIWLTALAVKRWSLRTVLLAPFFWAACEWLRLGVTGQLWNALGYSQASHPLLIQTASWGGVYFVSFLIITVNAALTLVVLKRRATDVVIAAALLLSVAALLGTSFLLNFREPHRSGTRGYLNVVAVQPNVPMSAVKTATDTQELIERHLTLSTSGLQLFENDNLPRLVIWPESPMNFTYSTDPSLQNLIGKFVKENHTSLLLNSLEPAPNNGGYNSAVMVNEDGRLIAQYDKIRLMPFGEYVPLPQWLGGSLISGIVGDFTAGDKYTLVPVADHKAGVFICIESAYPSIARNLTRAGADILINISNDGYLGPTAVMRQHLANAVFRAVENGRPLLRVTNSGISAAVSPDGIIQGATPGFVAGRRVWTVDNQRNRTTFYNRFGDLFVWLCAVLTVITLISTVLKRRRSFRTT